MGEYFVELEGGDDRARRPPNSTTGLSAVATTKETRPAARRAVTLLKEGFKEKEALMEPEIGPIVALKA